MLLGRLKLVDTLIFENVDIDLSNVSLASIIGTFANDKRKSNGSGKSSFVDAIRYILYDKTRSKNKVGVVREGQPKSVAELELDVEGNKLRIQRTRTSSGTSTSQLWVNGQNAGDKVKVVNEEIIRYLGVDADLFEQIYFFKQGDQFGFAEASASDRKAILAKVFKMDSLIKCQEAVAGKLRQARDAKQRADGAYEAALSRLSSMWSVNELNDRVLTAEGNLSTAQQLFEEYKTFQFETDSSLDGFATKFQEWKDEVLEDRTKSKNLEEKISKASNIIGSLQIEHQQHLSRHNSLKSELETAKFDCVECDGCIIELESEIEKKRKVVNNFDAQSKMNFKLAEEIEDKTSLKSLAGSDCPTCGQVVGVDHVEKALAESRSRAENYRALGKDFASKLIQANQELNYKVKLLNKRRDYEAKKKNVAVLANNVKQSEKINRQTEARISEQIKERDRAISEQNDLHLSVDVVTCENTHSQLDEHHNNLKNLKRCSDHRGSEIFSSIGPLQFQHSSACKDLEVRKSSEIDLEKAKEKREMSEKEVRIWSALSDAFGKNGIQALIIENTLGSIESFANDMLSKMQTRFIIELRTQKQLKSGEDREALDIIVYDNGTERPFESYSGGERTLINLSLRLSLSKTIGSLHGIKMQSLFLDEVLGALDEVNREEVVKVVAFLSRSFDQVFVISHTDEIKDMIDSSITILRHDRHSEVVLANHSN